MSLGEPDVLSLGPSIQTFSLGDLSHTRCKGLGKPLIGQRKHDATAEQRVCILMVIEEAVLAILRRGEHDQDVTGSRSSSTSN